jgi:UDP-N-acetylmuramoylalanine--D-glutamate ligase
MGRAVYGFWGLPHALERVAEIDGVQFINDSKATNVAAARRAFESFTGGVVAIMGGRYKGGDFGELRDVVAERATAIVAIGEAASRIETELGSATRVHHAVSMEDAVATARTLVRPGGVVLLAPGCSSFDMFADYVERGEKFRDAVGKLRE